MFVASTELLNIVSLHVCREQASVNTDLSTITGQFELPRIILNWLSVRCKRKFPILLLTGERADVRIVITRRTVQREYIYLLGIVRGVYKWNGIFLCSRRR